MTLTTTASFDADVLHSDLPVLVDFTADWCGPCRMVSPVLAQIAAERPDLRVVEVDADTNPELTLRYRVMGLPTIAVFQGGQMVASVVGARPKAAILAQVDDALSR